MPRLAAPIHLALALLFALVGWQLSAGAIPAPAAPLSGSAYDSGDGDEDNGLGSDWQAGVAGSLVTAAPDRTNDDCFIGGVKELTPRGWAFNTSAGGCI